MTLLRQLFGYLCYFFIIQSRGLTQYLNDFIFKPSLHYSAYFSLFPNFKDSTKFVFFSIHYECVEQFSQYDKVI